MPYSIIRVEDVGRWGVVYNDDFVEVPAQPTQVFNIVSLVEHAGLPEETVSEGTPFIQQVGDWIGILAQKENTHNIVPDVMSQKDVCVCVHMYYEICVYG